MFLAFLLLPLTMPVHDRYLTFILDISKKMNSAATISVHILLIYNSISNPLWGCKTIPLDE